jgi:D-sedoheptulose 7-phosphate isomerase
MAGTLCKSAQSYLNEFAVLLSRMDAAAIDGLTQAVCGAWKRDRMVIVLGNGGSAATASHWVADLLKTAAVDGQRRLRALCPSDNTGLLTAIGNDISYDETFLYPLQTYARAGDVVVAISASGNSPNVVRACEWVRHQDMVLAAITGFKGGKIADLCQLHINIPSENYGLIEDMHLSIGHMVAQGLKSWIMDGAISS